MTRAIAYTRVSTQEQEAGLEAQLNAIDLECTRRGWELTEHHVDKVSGSTPWEERPSLPYAIRQLERHEADVLVVAKLDRLSRSVADFAGLLERSQRKKWGVVALDIGVDTTTPVGEMVAHVLMAIARFELRMIGQRTREALAVKKANGVRLGRPPGDLGPQEAGFIATQRRSGISYRAIAANLTLFYPRKDGRRWHASHVRNVVRRDSNGTSA